jgi:hypothetical protein
MRAEKSDGLRIVAGFHYANTLLRQFYDKFHMFVARKEFLEDRIPDTNLAPFHHALPHRERVVLDEGGYCGVI